MKYRGIFEYEYPTGSKPPVSIDVHLHGDCVKGKIIEWEYRPLEQEQKTGHWIVHPKGIYAHLVCDKCLSNAPHDCRTKYCPNCGARMQEDKE